jgi:DNA-binding GntR family transcriptional regulator
MYRFQFGMASPRALHALGEHGHIVEAIERRDGELAEILMRRHIRASRENVERRLSREGAGPPATEAAGRLVGLG